MYHVVSVEPWKRHPWSNVMDRTAFGSPWQAARERRRRVAAVGRGAFRVPPAPVRRLS